MTFPYFQNFGSCYEHIMHINIIWYLKRYPFPISNNSISPGMSSFASF